MTTILDRIRRAVSERAQGCCEYCQTQQAIVIVMEVDHINPVSEGGQTVLDNLCFSCPTCNGHKLSAVTAVDPQTHEEVPLFNPRNQNWDEHFEWSEDKSVLIGLTSAGRATIHRLQINDPEIVKVRQRWIQASWHPPQQIR
jgi:hypothetical protein